MYLIKRSPDPGQLPALNAGVPKFQLLLNFLYTLLLGATLSIPIIFTFYRQMLAKSITVPPFRATDFRNTQLLSISTWPSPGHCSFHVFQTELVIFPTKMASPLCVLFQWMEPMSTQLPESETCTSTRTPNLPFPLPAFSYHQSHHSSSFLWLRILSLHTCCSFLGSVF